MGGMEACNLRQKTIFFAAKWMAREIIGVGVLASVTRVT